MDSYFHKGVILTGTLRIKGVVRFEGEFQGEIYAEDHFIVGKSGSVRGKIYVNDFTNMGKVKGDIRAEGKVSLVANSDLWGDVITHQLVVEEGVNFEGHCKMISRRGQPGKKAVKEVETLPELAVEQVPFHEKVPFKNAIRKFKMGKNRALAAAVIILIAGAGYLSYPKIFDNQLEETIARGYQYIEMKKYSDAEVEFFQGPEYIEEQS